VGLIVNVNKPSAMETTKEVVRIIENYGGKVFVQPSIGTWIGRQDICMQEVEFPDHIDLLIVLGGDGTLLGVARTFAHTGLPILGINMGHLGFLAEVEPKDLNEAILRVLHGDFYLENRMMLETEILRDNRSLGTWIGLNDVGVAKRSFGRMVTSRIFVDNMYVDQYSGDGVIVSSPTGSTAYSLSCGGPIVSPQMDAIVVTPISPHTLLSRPFVVSGEQVVRVEVCSSHDDVGLSVGGQGHMELKRNDIVLVRKSKYTTSLIKWHDRGFFDVLRTKLHMNPVAEQICEGNK
jgi:NAD+ kinase